MCTILGIDGAGQLLARDNHSQINDPGLYTEP